LVFQQAVRPKLHLLLSSADNCPALVLLMHRQVLCGFKLAIRIDRHFNGILGFIVRPVRRFSG
jgi:hypothetical protein